MDNYPVINTELARYFCDVDPKMNRHVRYGDMCTFCGEVRNRNTFLTKYAPNIKCVHKWGVGGGINTEIT